MSDDCNCPPIDTLMRGEVIGTKPPCPIHDTPERLAGIKLLPRIIADGPYLPFVLDDEPEEPRS